MSLSASRVAVDIETTALEPWKGEILGVGLYSPARGLDVYLPGKAAFPMLERLAAEGEQLVFQNGKFDLQWLAYHGAGRLVNGFDTRIAASLLAEKPASLSLDSLASYYLGLPSWKGDFKEGVAERDPAVMAMYCRADCKATWDLSEALAARLEKADRARFFRRLMDVVNMLTWVEARGFAFDREGSARLREQLAAQVPALEAELNALAGDYVASWSRRRIEARLAKLKNPEKSRARIEAEGAPFNWASAPEVLALLKARGLDCRKWDSKKRMVVESGDADVLRANKHDPLCAKLLELRGIEKQVAALESYTELVAPDGAIHGSFNVDVTRTGRLSSSSPNLQNVSRDKETRSLFRAAPGKTLVIADMAQIEVRVAAHYSGDRLLSQVFLDNLDFYGMIAREVLGVDCAPNDVKKLHPEKRQVAKVIGLSILYGAGAGKLTEQIKLKAGIAYSLDDGRRIIDNYFAKFSGLLELRKRVEQVVAERGFVRNLMGRPVDVSRDKVFQTGVNSLLQSSASDLLLFRQLEIYERVRAEGLDAQLISLIHDENIWQVAPHQSTRLAEIMKEVLTRTDDVEFRVPLKIDVAIGETWACKA